ncbi:sensor histidine kinase [Bacteroides helcogenes]|uniref:histidine kinase n=2 Tax=Bacteroides helcogenes TaxID=290053 RepID=E6SWM0_BACT6|nr:HAMP domain-containing sensor histidine kinase [Bacteroides helcogenes]ADV42618.1 integral membrane sensor signal transduction histidine kinase [Bacteroides helcogenes P 36-108]
MPTRKTTYCFIFHLIFLLLLAGHTVSLPAQNNPYKIADSLYPILQRAERLRADARCLAVVDTLYNEAVRLGDKKAQCLALTVPLRHYIITGDNNRMKKASEKLKAVSRANDCLQYYYYAWNQEAIQLLNSGHSLEALQKAEEMKKQAFTDDHPFGIYSCIRNMGYIQTSRKNFKLANQYYREALDYMLKNLPDQDPAPIYNNLASYCLGRDDKLGLEYCEKGIKSARITNNRITVMLMKCRLLYSMKRWDEFRAYCAETMQAVEQNKYPQTRVDVLIVQIYSSVLGRKYEEAHTYADLVMKIHREDGIKYHAFICEKAGDYQRALSYQTVYIRGIDSLSNLAQASDIAELNAQIGNERLKQENARLDLKNAGLLMEQMRQQIALDQSNAENSQLLLANRELEVRRLKAETERQRAETERQKAETERQKSETRRQKDLLKQEQDASLYRMTIACILIVSLLALVAFLIFYLQRRRKSMRQLQKKNQELAVARDEAQSANRMKSLFIQNMSHEIRTPLNSIVGFSQLIANPDMELEPEEQQEYSELIVSNSELLTTLVNDLLGLSELQSGKYVTKIASHSCADLCRESIATVTHRKPQDVKLYYTCDTPPDYTILTDGQRVRQVLINFLTNAEKHTERGEIHLHCSLTEVPGSVTFSVADTGCGIPPEQAEHIFGRFEKLDDFSQGFGLGLSICRLIADYMGAAVKLDTSYKGGARFLFVLPVNDNL